MVLKASNLSELKISEEDPGEVRSRCAHRWQDPHALASNMSYSKETGEGGGREGGRAGSQEGNKGEQNRDNTEDWKRVCDGDDGQDEDQDAMPCLAITCHVRPEARPR